MPKSLMIELIPETRWIIFARWIIVPGLLLWSTLYIIGYWNEDLEMMQFNCFNLMAFIGFAIAMLLIMLNPQKTAVIDTEE